MEVTAKVGQRWRMKGSFAHSSENFYVVSITDTPNFPVIIEFGNGTRMTVGIHLSNIADLLFDPSYSRTRLGLIKKGIL